LTCLLACLISFCPTFAQATLNQEDITKHVNHCSKYFSYYEKIHQIPSNLLQAVALTESGTWHKESKSLVPWPWTANLNGKSYYFKNKQEAVRVVKQMLEDGHKSIDVGCMQVNLYYHPDAFESLDDAFEPRENIAYAASFLKSNYKRHADWRNAVGAYHSETESLGMPYAARVLSHLKTITNKPALSVGSKYYASNNYRSNLRLNRPTYYKNIRRTASVTSKYALARRKSNIFIKVNHKSSYTKPKAKERDSAIEDVTQSALNNFSKEEKKVALID
jgi:hypothetical protein